MTTGSQPQTNDERPASLDRLDVLVGQWQLETMFDAGRFGPDSPAVTDRGGRTTFAWLDGCFFLTQRFTNDVPNAPSGLSIIGVGAEPETFSQHYYDSRGLNRTYQMTFRDNVWTLWRESPGFWQRYRGVISDDGNTITGAWESSPDGREWQHDFRLTYVKIDAES